jgi:Rrf2 family protein
MSVSQKCQYALRAVFELAKRWDRGPVKISEIAASQGIPVRFLEVILNQLKQGGFTESVRGKEGGYVLSRHPRELTVGEIIRFVEGPLGPVECVNGPIREKCPFEGQCVFLPLWERVRQSLSDIYDGTTFADLLEQEQRMQRQYTLEYSI